MSGNIRVNQYISIIKHSRSLSTLRGQRGLETDIHTLKMLIQHSVEDQLIMHNLQNSLFRQDKATGTHQFRTRLDSKPMIQKLMLKDTRNTINQTLTYNLKLPIR
ncbi:unnamed protein product [Paramecium octaurelia]|uniref:Uncharacterized protein n=1 Tax=Paramecium octaurelia TaxID=43137 RepID=A0A8S1X2Q6_PAROT|nr:unnamed protein product [Paramecium octaurelia]